MSDDASGFGPSEGDVADPKAQYERTPTKVLTSLSEKPLQQAMKVISYIDSLRERERKLLRLCSPKALALVAENGPEYLAAVQVAAE